LDEDEKLVQKKTRSVGWKGFSLMRGERKKGKNSAEGIFLRKRKRKDTFERSGRLLNILTSKGKKKKGGGKDRLPLVRQGGLE